MTSVRPAVAEDVPAVLPMVRHICAFHEAIDPDKYGFIAHPEDRYRNWLTARAGDPRGVFFVADAAAIAEPVRLVGFVVGTVEKESPIYRLAELGFIHDLWVEEPYRHEGIARQMLTLAIERFAQLGVKQIRLDVVANNNPAHQLFISCGFRESTMEMLLKLG